MALPTMTMYCHDPKCAGANGVEAPYHPRTWDAPAELADDACPRCGHQLHDEPVEEEEAA